MHLSLIEQWLRRTGFTYKQAITGTFNITLSANLLPMQLIHGGKTAQVS